MLFLIAASVEVLDEVEVDYITLPGWMTSIAHCKTFVELPANAQAYIRKIEEITQIPGELTSADLIETLSLQTKHSLKLDDFDIADPSSMQDACHIST